MSSGRVAASGRVPALLSSQMPAPALWLRSDVGLTFTSGKVTAWADQSGNGFNFSLNGVSVPFTPSDSTFANLPTVGSSTNAGQLIGPKPSVMLPGATSAEYFMALTASTSGSTGSGWGIRNTLGNNDGWGIAHSAGGLIVDDFCGGGPGGDPRFIWTPPTPPMFSPMIYNAISLPTTWQANINGAVSLASSPNTFTVGSGSGLTLFGFSTSIWKGVLAEMIVFPRVLAYVERQFVKTYLSRRYQIAVV